MSKQRPTRDPFDSDRPIDTIDHEAHRPTRFTADQDDLEPTPTPFTDRVPDGLGNFEIQDFIDTQPESVFAHADEPEADGYLVITMENVIDG